MQAVQPMTIKIIAFTDIRKIARLNLGVHGGSTVQQRKEYNSRASVQ